MKLRAPTVLMVAVLTIALTTLTIEPLAMMPLATLFDVGAVRCALAARIPPLPSDSSLRAALDALLREKERRTRVLSPDRAAVSPETISGAVLAEASLSANGGRVATEDGFALDFAPGSVTAASPVRISRSEAPPPEILGGSSELLGSWKVDTASADVFGAPVGVSMKLPVVPGPLSPDMIVPMISRDGRTWFPVPYTRDGDTLRFETTHFSILGAVLIGTAIGTAVLAVIRAPTELPSVFHDEAPFISSPYPDPEGWSIAWAKSLGSGDKGLKDEKALDIVFRTLWDDYRKNVIELSELRDKRIARARESNLPVEPILDELQPLFGKLRENLERNRARAFMQYGVPDSVIQVREALLTAKRILVTDPTGRGFADPGPITVFVTSKPGANDGETIIRWTSNPYLFLCSTTNRDTLYLTVLHEYFHAIQKRYLSNANPNIFLTEATATLLERETIPQFDAKGLKISSYLADLGKIKTGLKGPKLPLLWGDAKPYQRFGYGMSWFLEFIRDEVYMKDFPTSKKENFQKNLLAHFRDTNQTPAFLDVLTWAAGGDAKKLGKVLVDYAEKAIFPGLPGATLYERTYIDAQNRFTVFDDPKTLHEVVSLDAEGSFELNDTKIAPWSVQFFEFRPAPQANRKVRSKLAVVCPAEWFDTSKTVGRKLYIRNAGDANVAALTPGANGVREAVPFDVPRRLSVIDTGQTGSGWVYEYSTGRVFLLDPPHDLRTTVIGNASALEGASLRIDWTLPAVAAKTPELLEGFDLDIVVSSADPRVLYHARLDPDETTHTVPAGSSAGGVGAANLVNRNALLRMTTVVKGEPRLASFPAEALIEPDRARIIPFFENRSYWLTASPLGNDPNAPLPHVPMRVSSSVAGLDGEIRKDTPEWNRLMELNSGVQGAAKAMEQQLVDELKKLGLSHLAANPETMKQAMDALRMAGIGLHPSSPLNRAVVGSGYRRRGTPVVATVSISIPNIPLIPLRIADASGSERVFARLTVRKWFVTTGFQTSPEVQGASGSVSLTWDATAGSPASPPPSPDLPGDSGRRIVRTPAQQDAFSLEIVVFYTLEFLDGQRRPVVESGLPVRYENLSATFPAGMYFCPVNAVNP